MTEHEQRRQTVAQGLAGHKIDVLLVSSPSNIRYLSGYSGSNGLMFVSAGESHFFTDPRYRLAVSDMPGCAVHVVKGPLIPAASALLKRKKLKKIGIESSWISYQDYIRLKDSLPLGSSLQPVTGLVEALRMVKSLEEIGLIRKSVQVNSAAYSLTLKHVKAGMQEQEIAAELDYQMRKLGAEKPAFDTIVAAGANSALPHAHPSAHRLIENELLLTDMGASLNGYSSDMTRVAYLGKPARRVRALYRAVLEAQLSAVDAVRSGIEAGKVDRAARSVLKKHGLEREFVHSTGHGLGLEIHEPPRIGRKEKTRLQAGMVITIEPGAYIDGFCGVRIEDTVLVTESGCEVLTPTSKELVSL
ncbi:MAG: Xaa-Pro peptidase family protein [Bryobacteraceae bacterium]